MKLIYIMLQKLISAFANSPKTKKKDILAFHMSSECDKNKDKYNSIDYIDQASAADQVNKIKGYITVEESNVLNKQPLEPDKDNGSDFDLSSSTTQPSKSSLKPKSKTKQKSNGTKKKCRKEKTKSTSSSESVIMEPGTSRNAEERVSKTKVTTTETTKVVTTTTSLNRYTITQINDVGNGNPDKKVRTHSCSSIPYDDIIDNLAVFRKSFDNVQFFHDESQNLVPIENITEKKVCIKIPEAMDSDEHVRNFATTFVADIIESASKVINNKSKTEVQKTSDYDSMSDSASHENRLKCETSSTALYAPIIIHTPSTDNLIDAQNFVEEYEEYHDSCSEISDGKLNVLTTDITTGNNDKVNDKSKGKKKKDKTVKLGVTRCIPVETDSNAEDDSDFPQSEMQLVPYDAKFNLPKNIFSKMNNTEMVEITDQNIDILHQNVEIAENNPDMMEQPVLNVFNTQESKEFTVEDEDDVYKPIAVSPCGRFFKYEEEVNNYN